ncbi:MAG: DUF4912 domain-containing protein [Deltaproteobacteria bacterium]|nr:DUF4912 domain-containing protein [Deltaproteobacteria bacterium]
MRKHALEEMTKSSLMKMAREVKLSGRSRMTKGELVQALSHKNKAGKGEERGVKRREKNILKASTLRSALEHRPVRRKMHLLESCQEEVERVRFEPGMEEKSFPAPPPVIEELPEGYGDDRIVLMVRDPYWIYAYWEIQEGTIAQALHKNGLAEHAYRQVVRVYAGDQVHFSDIDVEGLTNNWYINMGRPDTEFFADFGVMVGERFLRLVRSNSVQTPRAGMSDVVDEQWVTLNEEAEEMYALSGGFRIGRGEGSAGLQETQARRFEAELSSGGISSFFGSGRFREMPRRGFWYQLDAELIVYGATEPDAWVTLQGKPIRLRPDGTFTARFALPDGRQVIPVTFVSADRVDEATVTPRVERKTDRQ